MTKKGTACIRIRQLLLVPALLVGFVLCPNLSLAAGSSVPMYEQSFEALDVGPTTRSKINAQPDLLWNGGCYSTLSSGFFNKGYDSFQVSKEFARSGVKSLRIENHVGSPSDDPCTDTAIKSRAEVRFAYNVYEFSLNDKLFSDLSGWSHGAERWIGLSYYLPGLQNQKWYSTAASRIIILQIFGRLSAPSSSTDASPIFHIMLGKNGDLSAAHAYSDASTAEAEYTKHPVLPNGFKLDQWNDIVIHHKKHYLPAQALLQVWVNGKLWIDFDGGKTGIGTAPKKFDASYFKAGLYRGLQEPNDYTIFLDSIRIANESGSYETVSPSNGSITPPASPILQVE